MNNDFGIFDSKRIELNGPVNVLRIEGSIGSGPKVVYLFLDDQSPITKQTQCLNVHSIDIYKYLINTFHTIKMTQPTLTSDFFVDLTPAQFRVDPAERAQAILTQGTIIDRFTYAEQIQRLVTSANIYEKSTQQTLASEIFPNIRLHYANITEGMTNNIVRRLAYVESIVRNPPPPGAYLDTDVYNLLEQVKLEIGKYMRIYQVVTDRPPTSIEEPNVEFARHLRKLLHSYNFPQVRKVITESVHTYFDQLSALSGQIDRTIKLFVTTTHSQEEPNITYADGLAAYDIARTRINIETSGQRVLSAHMLFINAIQIISNISDCYLLRRLLDKAYVDHAIIYTNREKALHYIQVLLGNFDFTITHAAYIPETIESLNQASRQRIRNNQSIADLFVYPNMPQCSDLTDFPPNLA